MIAVRSTPAEPESEVKGRASRYTSAVFAGLLLVAVAGRSRPPRTPAVVSMTATTRARGRAEVIFTGTVIGERTLGYNRTYAFAVTKVYKAHTPSSWYRPHPELSLRVEPQQVGAEPRMAGGMPPAASCSQLCGGTLLGLRG